MRVSDVLGGKDSLHRTQNPLPLKEKTLKRHQIKTQNFHSSEDIALRSEKTAVGREGVSYIAVSRI